MAAANHFGLGFLPSSENVLALQALDFECVHFFNFCHLLSAQTAPFVMETRVRIISVKGMEGTKTI